MNRASSLPDDAGPHLRRAPQSDEGVANSRSTATPGPDARRAQWRPARLEQDPSPPAARCPLLAGPWLREGRSPSSVARRSACVLWSGQGWRRNPDRARILRASVNSLSSARQARVTQRLQHVLALEVRVVREDLLYGSSSANQTGNHAHGDPHAPDGGLAAPGSKDEEVGSPRSGRGPFLSLVTSHPIRSA